MSLRTFFMTLPLAIFAVLVWFFLRGLHQDSHAVPSVLIGQPVPAFTATTLEGKTFTNSDFPKQVYLLNVWASWCITCRAEHQMLEQIHSQYKVPIYGLNYKDKPDTANGWLSNFGNPYAAVISDPRGAVGINLGVYGVPETFVVDKQGIIRYKQIGDINERNWQQVIWPLIQSLK